MVLGTVPLAIASGAGAESRQQIGWVLVGGLTLGTLLTLYVVPVAYTLIAGRRTRAQAAADSLAQSHAGGAASGGQGSTGAHGAAGSHADSARPVQPVHAPDQGPR